MDTKQKQMNVENPFKLAKHTSWYNPFELMRGNCSYGYVYEIRIFKDGKTVASSHWMADGSNPYYEIELPFEIGAKRKEDLNTVRAYTMPKKKAYKSEQPESILYIHADLLDSFKLTRKKAEAHLGEIYVKDNDMTAEFTANVIMSADKYGGDERFKPHRVEFTVFNQLSLTEYGALLESMASVISDKTMQYISVYEMRDILSVVVKELNDPETKSIIEKNSLPL